MKTLCRINDIPEPGARGFEIEGRKLFAVRYRGAVYVYENNCPHRNIPLEWQPDQFLDYDKIYIQCATHGALFQIETGLCISGPCVKDSLTPVKVSIEDGNIRL
ncbi:MAG: (2Fe-2S)-binding protein [Neptuniibacter caesariensis]|uniref:(2Fe-2S)-binding protein n=1 Tax=Neptuniibacter caesariensis TaxID=207954 RepID=A0A2G6JBN0_NEPCE|nr:MAG: (2Fe-2S)-binding protein [Neptuniibacter caesariensis]